MTLPDGRSIAAQLVAASLFRPGRPAVHVNLPRHDGDTPVHGHDFWEAAVVLEGEAVHRSAAGLERAGPGFIAILRPGQWHAWEACRALRLANCCIGRDLLLHELAWCASDPQLGPLLAGGAGGGVLTTPCPPSTHVPAAMRRVRERHLSSAAPQPALILAALLELLHALAEALGPRLPRSAERLAPAVAIVRDALLADLRRDWSLDHLAALAGLGSAQLGRLCQRHLGAPPLRWLQHQRLERAALLLLTTEAPIAAIGAAVGWSDPNCFSRRFRAGFGVSPGAWRRQLPTPALATAPDWVQW